jgi:hypothetical protein
MTLISRNRFAMLFRPKMKKNFLFLILVAMLAASGCSWFKWRGHAAAKPGTTSQTIVTPDTSLEAKVISVNPVGRFVVLNFPGGQLPKLQQTLFIYRAGLAVAEAKVTGPQQENNIVADLVSGEARIGDTVRDQ